MPNIHATGVLLDRHGVLIRGPSGHGKTLLALCLLDRFALLGKPAALVGDDRLDLEPTPAGLIMTPPPLLRGKIELRGRGILDRPFEASAPVHLVVDLVEELERMPEESAFLTELCGLALPRAPVPRTPVVDRFHQLLLVEAALRTLA